jgi:hypothetical protein
MILPNLGDHLFPGVRFVGYSSPKFPGWNFQQYTLRVKPSGFPFPSYCSVATAPYWLGCVGRGIIPGQMIKWADDYIRKRDDLRERGARDAREGKDATAFHDLGLPRWYPNDPTFYTDLYTEYELAYYAEKADLLRKAKALHWFAEFSEGVMGWVPEPSPLVVNALIDAIERWLKEPNRTAY